ncbi:cobalamin biosynthesis protein CbiX [Salmonella enterica]|nr:cobalamin biosynthesis protein CbiX [Salmonella enterica]
MLLVNAIKKHFDIDTHTLLEELEEEGVENPVFQIWIYEVGFDSEPLLILKDARHISKFGGWIVANIYSNLEEGKVYSESEFKELLKKNKIQSRYS